LDAVEFRNEAAAPLWDMLEICRAGTAESSNAAKIGHAGAAASSNAAKIGRASPAR
jgi:hypothetical protein